jgi:sensor histidine kinase YesM
MIRILQQWYRQQNRAEALERARLGAELSFLKSQIHPHFLFNTLNNLYSLTLKQSEHAPRVVLKLSELLNYMLYEASGKEVLLSREVLHLKNYVELEKIRYGNELEISLNAGEGVEGKKIEPMILLPFVENSFKHGLSQELSKPWITIDLKVKGDLLIFSVENSKVPGITLESKSGGIGLNNVRRRLELLYPGSYELLTTDHGDYFAVSLKLDLSKCTRYA